MPSKHEKKHEELAWPTLRQVHILMTLANNRRGLGGLEICEESEPGMLHAPSIYQILRKCVGHGWVAKTGFNADAVWKITPLGRKAIKAYRALHA
jgi:hypothetical protein